MEADDDIREYEHSIEDVYGREDDDYFDEEPYEEDIEELDYADEDEYKSMERESDEVDDYMIAEDISRLDTGAEWRDFRDSGDPSKSRVGMARPTDIDEDLGTMIVDEKFQKIGRMTKTPEDIFRAIVLKTVSTYRLDKWYENEASQVMQLINKHNMRLKYRSPQAIVLALLVFDGEKISKSKLEEVYKEKIFVEKAKHQVMSKLDLLRYALFIQHLRSLS